MILKSTVFWRGSEGRRKERRCISETGRKIGRIKGKTKAIPLQTWTGTQGYRRLRLPDFKTIGT
jgi:hypothetical protein